MHGILVCRPPSNSVVMDRLMRSATSFNRPRAIASPTQTQAYALEISPAQTPPPKQQQRRKSSLIAPTAIPIYGTARQPTKLPPKQTNPASPTCQFNPESNHHPPHQHRPETTTSEKPSHHHNHLPNLVQPPGMLRLPPFTSTTHHTITPHSLLAISRSDKTHRRESQRANELPAIPQRPSSYRT
jgi:hypothetical protein